MVKNLKKLFSCKVSVFIFVASSILLFLLLFFMTDYWLLRWNLWDAYANFDIFLNIILSLLFWKFISTNIYKARAFWAVNQKAWIIGFLWTFMWALITGCPTCSLTIAYYLGLASIFTTSVTFFGYTFNLFPFWWIELKVIWIAVLAYSVYVWIKNLEACAIKKG